MPRTDECLRSGEPKLSNNQKYHHMYEHDRKNTERRQTYPRYPDAPRIRTFILLVFSSTKQYSSLKTTGRRGNPNFSNEAQLRVDEPIPPASPPFYISSETTLDPHYESTIRFTYYHHQYRFLLFFLKQQPGGPQSALGGVSETAWTPAHHCRNKQRDP